MPRRMAADALRHFASRARTATGDSMAATPREALSTRQREILRLIAAGMTDREIARLLAGETDVMLPAVAFLAAWHLFRSPRAGLAAWRRVTGAALLTAGCAALTGAAAGLPSLSGRILTAGGLTGWAADLLPARAVAGGRRDRDPVAVPRCTLPPGSSATAFRACNARKVGSVEVTRSPTRSSNGFLTLPNRPFNPYRAASAGSSPSTFATSSMSCAESVAAKPCLIGFLRLPDL